MRSTKTGAGFLLEFDSAEALLAGIEKVRGLGYRPTDAYTPYPMHGIEEALGMRRSRIPRLMGLAALLGASGAYALQWFFNVYNYPLNVGGRPPHMSSAFIPVTFEMGILFAGFAAVLGTILLAGLPRLWHPVFEIEGFERATIDRFWLSIRLDGLSPSDREKVRTALEQAGALRVVFLEEGVS